MSVQVVDLFTSKALGASGGAFLTALKPLLVRSKLAGLVYVECGVAAVRCHDIIPNPEEGWETAESKSCIVGTA